MRRLHEQFVVDVHLDVPDGAELHGAEQDEKAIKAMFEDYAPSSDIDIDVHIQKYEVSE